MSLKKSPDDKTYCKSIAKSISDIIRFSLDEKFRKKSFELFGVCSTKETEREIRKRLTYLAQTESTDFQSKKVTSQNSNENFSGQKEKQNSHAQNDSQSNTETILTQGASAGSNFQAASKNIKRNWLQISSEQYKSEVMKRKKLNYHSQPQLGQSQQNRLEFLRYCDSQPSSSCSSPLSEGKISLSQPVGDAVNYCNEKFRDSFKDNAQKYFKKNLKCNFNPKPNTK